MLQQQITTITSINLSDQTKPNTPLKTDLEILTQQVGTLTMEIRI